MDRQSNHLYKNMMAGDWQLGTMRFVRKFQDKDLCICYSNKPCLMDNQNLIHILVDILHKDFQYSLECMNMMLLHFVLYS